MVDGVVPEIKNPPVVENASVATPEAKNRIPWDKVTSAAAQALLPGGEIWGISMPKSEVGENRKLWYAGYLATMIESAAIGFIIAPGANLKDILITYGLTKGLGALGRLAHDRLNPPRPKDTAHNLDQIPKVLMSAGNMEV